MASHSISWTDRLEQQAVIFAKQPGRSTLGRLPPFGGLRAARVGVVRNRPFEFVAKAAGPFAGFAGYELTFDYSDYDDSLSDVAVASGADVVLVWLDYSHYTADGDFDFDAWLGERLSAVRAVTGAPIVLCRPDNAEYEVLNDRLEALAKTIPDCQTWKIGEIRDALGEGYFDARMAAVSGDNISGQGVIQLARDFALRIVPRALEPRLKAIILDLDHTLYAGVLGEDGVEGVQLTEAHAALQRAVVAYQEQGVFVAVLSKNELVDAQDLFERRTDFPLRASHVSAWSVSWEPKAIGLGKILNDLRIGADAAVFVDDNIGELLAVGDAHPGLRLIPATADAEQTLCALDGFPGLLAGRVSEADKLRARDLAASAERQAVEANVQSPAEYMQRLGVKIALGVDPHEQLERLADLSRKTNQFNFNLTRLAQTDLAGLMDSDDGLVIGAWLSDKLSDAGLVTSFAVRRDGDMARVVDLAMSCRSLGRGIEDVMLTQAFDAAARELGVSRFAVDFTRGPRNQPGLAWLEQFAGVPLPDGGAVEFDWDSASRLRATAELPLDVTWREH
jgi:FkbH-like protein